jgi:signal transduction histidine kinase
MPNQNHTQNTPSDLLKRPGFRDLLPLKIALAMICLAVAITGIVTLFTYDRTIRREHQRILDTVNLFVVATSTAIADSIENNDKPLLKILANAANSLDAIDGVEINVDVIASGNNTIENKIQVGKIPNNPNLPTLIYTITSTENKKQIGILTLYPAHDWIAEKVQDEVNQQAITTLITTLVLSFTSFLLVTLFVTNPLRKMAAAVHDFETESTSSIKNKLAEISAILPTRDSIGTLATAFSELIERVNKNVSSLKSSNSQLEQNIEERIRQAEISASIASSAIKSLGASYSVWSADEKLINWATSLNVDGRQDWAFDTAYKEMPWSEFLAHMRNVGVPNTSNETKNAQGHNWYSDTPLRERVGVWEREKINGTFLRTIISKHDDGTYIVITLNLTEIHTQKIKAEQIAHMLSHAIKSIGASYSIWSADEKLIAIDSSIPYLLPLTSASYVGMPWTEYMYAAQDRSRETPNKPGETINAMGRKWLDDKSLDESIGTWDREKTNGVFLRTIVSKSSDGIFYIVTLDLTEINNARRQAETNEQIAREVVIALGSSYTVWNEDEKLIAFGRADESRTLFPYVQDKMHMGMTYQYMLETVAKHAMIEVEHLSTVRNGTIYGKYTPIKSRLGKWRRVFPDGRIFDAFVVPLKNGGYVIPTMNVTEIIQSKQKAEENEQILREAVFALNGIYSVWNEKSCLRLISENFDRMDFGIPRSQIRIGMPFAEMMDNLRESGFIAIPEKSTQHNGKTYDQHTSVSDVVGIWNRAYANGRFLRTVVSPIHTGGFSIITIDLTEIENLKRKTEHTVQTLREIMGHLDVKFATYDRNEKLLLWGDQASQTKDNSPSKYIPGIAFADVLKHRLDHGYVEREDGSTTRNGHTFSFYTPLSERLGTWERKLTDGRQLRTRVIQLIDGNYAVFSQDMTQFYETQEILAKNEQMSALGSLVAGIAHEVSTPISVAMTAISTYVGDVQKIDQKFKEKSLSTNEFVRFVERAIELMELLTRNIDRANNLFKNFKQVSVDQLSDQRRRFELNEYFEEIVSSLAPTYKTTKHKVEIAGSENIIMNAYPGAVAQIVTNLITNAMMHAYPDQNACGQISFELINNDTDVLIIYRDDGVGIDNENTQRIFEPFYTTKRNAGGTGLGLTIVYNLVTHRLGGRISVANRATGGLQIDIMIPKISPEKTTRHSIIDNSSK